MKKTLAVFIPLLALCVAAQCEDSPETGEPAVERGHDFEVTDRLEFQTSMGDFTVGLYGNDAPITVENFLSYVDDGSFEEVIFHRVIADFMIQAGMMTSTEEYVPTRDPIPLEIIPGLKHTPGVISMARSENPTSATNQFFVCVAAHETLDGEYAAFGKVESGYEVVEAISRVETTSMGMYDDVPIDKVVIHAVSRLE